MKTRDEFHEAMRAVLSRTGAPRTAEDYEAVLNAVLQELRRRGIWTIDSEERLRAVLSPPVSRLDDDE